MIAAAVLRLTLRNLTSPLACDTIGPGEHKSRYRAGINLKKRAILPDSYNFYIDTPLYKNG